MSEPWIVWAIIAVVLGATELLVRGVFLAFAALAAAITAILAGLLPGLGLGGQLLSFGAWTAVTVLIGRRWYRDYPVASADPLLNDRAARLAGASAIVADAIVGGEGRVRIGDGEWPARGPDAPVGARVRVIAVEQGVARVEPLPPALP